LSFSCLAPEVVASQTDTLSFYKKGLAHLFSPVGPDGRPFRKFSERKDSHWFHSEKDGLSYAGTNQAKQESRDLEKLLPMPQSEPISSDATVLRKPTFTPTLVDKHVIKGSMAKVVGGAQVVPLQRFLM
jgi:hypothetical protein